MEVCRSIYSRSAPWHNWKQADMSYRGDPKDTGEWLRDLERRTRALEANAVRSPDPDWVLREVAGGLYFIYVPSGATGPQVGSK